MNSVQVCQCVYAILCQQPHSLQSSYIERGVAPLCKCHPILTHAFLMCHDDQIHFILLMKYLQKREPLT